MFMENNISYLPLRALTFSHFSNGGQSTNLWITRSVLENSLLLFCLIGLNDLWNVFVKSTVYI